MRSPPDLLGGGLPGLHELYYHFAISLSLSSRLPAGYENLGLYIFALTPQGLLLCLAHTLDWYAKLIPLALRYER